MEEREIACKRTVALNHEIEVDFLEHFLIQFLRILELDICHVGAVLTMINERKKGKKPHGIQSSKTFQKVSDWWKIFMGECKSKSKQLGLSKYLTETSPLICSANQLTGFYMITASVMKGWNGEKVQKDVRF